MWSFHRSDILIIVFQIYFSADILFPWAIYYFYVLHAITDSTCSSSWFDNIDFDYDEFRAERDAALIRYFVQQLWECVKTLLPSNVFHVIWNYTCVFLTRNSISPTRIYIWSGSAITGLSQRKAGKPAFPCFRCSFLN